MTFPMFPLGSVVVPGQILPLHVFEDRYQRMVRHCLEGNREFGVVLIERGSEVGGGDVRSTIGTAVRIAEAVEVTEGHWAVIGIGARRIRVVEWGADGPWPRAEVADLPDVDGDADHDQRYADLRRQYRRVVALASEVTDFQPAEDDPSVGPGPGTFHLAALSPLGAFDRQRVLCTDSVAGRMELLGELFADLEATMRAELDLQ